MTDRSEIIFSLEEMEKKLFPEKKVVIISISKMQGNFGEPREWKVTYQERT